MLAAEPEVELAVGWQVVREAETQAEDQVLPSVEGPQTSLNHPQAGRDRVRIIKAKKQQQKLTNNRENGQIVNGILLCSISNGFKI